MSSDKWQPFCLGLNVMYMLLVLIWRIPKQDKLLFLSNLFFDIEWLSEIYDYVFELCCCIWLDFEKKHHTTGESSPVMPLNLLPEVL